MLNIRRFFKGLQIVPVSSTSVSQQGEVEVLSTNSKIIYHNGTSASPVVTEVHASQGANRLQNKDLDTSSVILVDPSDTTKQIKFDDSAATTGTSLTLAGIQTANRVITFPDVTGTVLVGSTPGVIANNLLDEASVWFVDTSDHTKALKADSSASTTGTSTTLKNSQTANRVLTLPDATDTLVGKATTDTLTNKTLSGNTASNLVNGSGTLNINSSGTVTVPNATDTLVGKATTDTLSNKTLDNTSVITIKDANLTIQDDADPTKQAKFQASSISTATTRTLTLPDANTILVGTDVSQTLTNKVLSGNTASNLINGGGTFNLNSSGTITAPNATDTLVGQATVDILTNKTFDDEITAQQISTPSSPPSGYDKLYFKSDDRLYTKNSAGSEQLVGPTSTSGINNYWSGFYQHGQYWQTTVAGTFTNFLPIGVPVLTQRTGAGITVGKPTGISTGVDVAGISWTPPSVTATYLITMTSTLNTNVNDYALVKMTDGTQTMTQLEWLSTTSQYVPFTLSALYTPGTTSTVEVVMFGYVGSGNLTLGVATGDYAPSTPLDITLIQITS